MPTAVCVPKLNALPVLLPPRTEQDQIVVGLRTATAREQIECDQLAKLRLLKAGMMEDLLTGRVRVTKLVGGAAE